MDIVKKHKSDFFSIYYCCPKNGRIKVKLIPPESTYNIRNKVLWPHKNKKIVIYLLTN